MDKKDKEKAQSPVMIPSYSSTILSIKYPPHKTAV